MTSFRLPQPPALVAGALAFALSGCFPTDAGPEPPDAALYFPTALAVSPGGGALYVANSNFDLQYTAGTLQVLDLARVRALVPKFWEDPNYPNVDCSQYGLAAQNSGQQLLYPAPCGAIPLDAPPDGQGSLIRNTTRLGAFASALKIVHPPSTCVGREEPSCQQTGARLLSTVRGDPSVTWLTIDDDRPDASGNARQPASFTLDCGQGSNGGRCDDGHRAGIAATENTRFLTMPAEPFQMAISPKGDAAVVTHQATGNVSLLLTGWGAGGCYGAGNSPSLSFVAGGLPTGATGIATIPPPLYVLEHPELTYQPGFLVSYRSSSQIDLMRYYDDCNASPARPFVARAATSSLSTNSGGFDSRSIATDDGERRACEDACGNDQNRDSCLIGCAALPVRVYVANRRPASLVIGETRANASQIPPNESVRFFDPIPLPVGASNVRIGKVIDRNGQPATRVFAISFDTRRITVYDPTLHRIESTISTGRGPADLVFDPGSGDAASDRNFAYLAHFTDSYLTVIDLDMRHQRTYLTPVLNVAAPTPPRDSK